MNTEDIAASLDRCFISANVSDSNMEPANVVDVIERAANNLNRIAVAITPTVAGATTPNGIYVGSLTEAMIAVADSMARIAESISDLASAVRERDS